MAMKLKNDSVAHVVGRTATGRDAQEASEEFIERTRDVKPLVTREEINAWIEAERRKHQQTQQQAQ